MSGRADNANTMFLTEYEFDGIRWGGEVWAATREEAEMKLRAMAGGEVLGPCGGVVMVGKCPTCGRGTETEP